MTEETRLIQGRQPDSIEEARVANALDKYHVDYIYQYPIMGGRRVRGGQIVDFLLRNPFPTPLQVFGEYWHKAELSAGATLGLVILRNYFGRDPVVLWGSELETQEEANETIRRKVL